MAKNWFIYIGGDTFGPLTTDIVLVMLKQTRLHFTDYIWQIGLTKWVRISEVDEYAGLMPPYPKNPIPSGIKTTAEAPPPPVPPAKFQEPKEGERSGTVQKKETLKESVTKSLSKLAMHPRFKVEGTIKTDAGIRYEIVDLSEGGVFLASKKEVEVGTEVTFTLEAKGLEEKMKMTGLVIRNGERHEMPGFAIEFTRVNPVYKRLLRNFLAEKPDDG